MKLVGATDAFVRGPFIVEGIMYGIIATTIAAAAVVSSARMADPYLRSFFGTAANGLTYFFEHNFFVIFGAEFGTLVILTILGTLLASRKYMRV